MLFDDMQNYKDTCFKLFTEKLNGYEFKNLSTNLLNVLQFPNIRKYEGIYSNDRKKQRNWCYSF